MNRDLYSAAPRFTSKATFSKLYVFLDYLTDG